jgi:hypothetical protein
MPGVYRPYTLVDILSTLNNQSGGSMVGSDQIISGLGFFAETDEGMTFTDSMITTVQANPAYDNGEWGSVTWG